MARPLHEILIDFIAALREAGIRISVAESLDAMHAVAVAGLRPTRVREALRASLIKDEVDNPRFDQIFADYFAAPQRAGQSRQSRGDRVGLIGAGHGDGSGINPVAPQVPSKMPSTRQSKAARTPDAVAEVRSEADRQKGTPKLSPGSQAQEAEHGPESRDTHSSREFSPLRDDGTGTGEGVRMIPFADYSSLEHAQAREILALLQKRLRVRLGRRLRRAKAGKIDLRRTLHASVQRGGALIDLQLRTRRPRHIDLVALADISGSVHYAATLMLELLAATSRCFRRVHNFVYVDRIANAAFERGHLVMTPNLDLYARSDFGRVLSELVKDYLELFNSSTILLILGDGRNNRRPARADLLRDLARRCRLTLWLNPEPVERWGVADSAIESYRKAVDYVLPCLNLDKLVEALIFIG